MESSTSFFSFLQENLQQFMTYTSFANITWGHVIMICVGLVFIYLAIAKEYEPMLLVPIGFGIIIGNVPFFPGLTSWYLRAGERYELPILWGYSGDLSTANIFGNWCYD